MPTRTSLRQRSPFVAPLKPRPGRLAEPAEPLAPEFLDRQRREARRHRAQRLLAARHARLEIPQHRPSAPERRRISRRPPPHRHRQRRERLILSARDQRIEPIRQRPVRPEHPDRFLARPRPRDERAREPLPELDQIRAHHARERPRAPAAMQKHRRRERLELRQTQRLEPEDPHALLPPKLAERTVGEPEPRARRRQRPRRRRSGREHLVREDHAHPIPDLRRRPVKTRAHRQRGVREGVARQRGQLARELELERRRPGKLNQPAIAGRVPLHEPGLPKRRERVGQRPENHPALPIRRRRPRHDPPARTDRHRGAGDARRIRQRPRGLEPIQRRPGVRENSDRLVRLRKSRRGAARQRRRQRRRRETARVARTQQTRAAQPSGSSEKPSRSPL